MTFRNQFLSAGQHCLSKNRHCDAYWFLLLNLTPA